MQPNWELIQQTKNTVNANIQNFPPQSKLKLIFAFLCYFHQVNQSLATKMLGGVQANEFLSYIHNLQ